MPTNRNRKGKANKQAVKLSAFLPGFVPMVTGGLAVALTDGPRVLAYVMQAGGTPFPNHGAVMGAVGAIFGIGAVIGAKHWFAVNAADACQDCEQE